MTKAKIRQQRIFNLLKDQGVGIINITNLTLAAILDIPLITLKRDLEAMDNDKIIIRETSLVNSNGKTIRQRDIIIKEQAARRFSLNQHRELSDRNNHNITVNEHGEVVWHRKIGKHWERNMIDKEFKNITQAYEWCYAAMANHHKKYTEGDRYISRT